MKIDKEQINRIANVSLYNKTFPDLPKITGNTYQNIMDVFLLYSMNDFYTDASFSGLIRGEMNLASAIGNASFKVIVGSKSYEILIPAIAGDSYVEIRFNLDFKGGSITAKEIFISGIAICVGAATASNTFNTFTKRTVETINMIAGADFYVEFKGGGTLDSFIAHKIQFQREYHYVVKHRTPYEGPLD